MEDTLYVRMKAKLFLRSLEKKKGNVIFSYGVNRLHNTSVKILEQYEEHYDPMVGLWFQNISSYNAPQKEYMIVYFTSQENPVGVPLVGAHVIWEHRGGRYVTHLDNEGKILEELLLGVGSKSDRVVAVILPHKEGKVAVLGFQQ